jgi:hypothetical protein
MLRGRYSGGRLIEVSENEWQDEAQIPIFFHHTSLDFETIRSQIATNGALADTFPKDMTVELVDFEAFKARVSFFPCGSVRSSSSGTKSLVACFSSQNTLISNVLLCSSPFTKVSSFLRITTPSSLSPRRHMEQVLAVRKRPFRLPLLCPVVASSG